MSGLQTPEITRESDDHPATNESRPTDSGRAVVTLPPAVADATRRMASRMGDVGTAEVVRRGLMLLDLYLSLSPDEELVVRNKATHECERLRFAWQTF